MTKIQILGTGCRKCRELAENAEAAARAAGIEFEIEKVADLNAIMRFGVVLTPALVVDGQVKLVGRSASPAEIAKLLD